MAERTGVLLTAFGGPDSVESVGPFMSRFMGREPSAAVVASAQDKYRAIGGSSPLPRVAAAIAAALERHLADLGHDIVVRAGMRYWEPSIECAVDELVEEGARRIVMASLSAFESKVTCEAFRSAAADAVRQAGIVDLREAQMLSGAPQYRDFFGHACAQALSDGLAARPLVVMTAHSLPVEDVCDDDPYSGGLREVSEAVAAIAGLCEGADFVDDERLPGVVAFGALEGRAPWLLAYQSRGARPGEWLGPDLGRVMEVAAGSGYDGIVVVPVGFAIDHMETLWDLDLEAAEQARSLGIGFVRTAVPNDDDSLVDALMWAAGPLL
ncbi:MAG: ferrochelatase [Coriobacteriia bacterium]|nr:ferrochelatase [Coriobacteriia bacterium]